MAVVFSINPKIVFLVYYKVMDIIGFWVEHSTGEEKVNNICPTIFFVVCIFLVIISHSSDELKFIWRCHLRNISKTNLKGKQITQCIYNATTTTLSYTMDTILRNLRKVFFFKLLKSEPVVHFTKPPIPS